MTAQDWLNALYSLIGTVAGGIITYFVARWQLKRSSGDLSATSSELMKASQSIQGDLKEFKSISDTKFEKLGSLSEELGKQIINIQEATRQLLRDFPQIFVKAQSMLQNCRERFWILNFTPCFGRVHACNKKCIADYSKDVLRSAQVDFEKDSRALTRAIDEFVADVQKKAKTIADFRLATTDPDDFGDEFLEPVIAKIPSELLHGAPESVWGKILSDHRTSVENIKALAAKHDDEAADHGKKKDERVIYLEKVPLQMFLADNGKDGQNTCLVFFIGSDNIAVEREVKGFYTEYSSLVKLFEEIFDSIVRHHKKKPPSNLASGGSSVKTT